MPSRNHQVDDLFISQHLEFEATLPPQAPEEFSDDLKSFFKANVTVHSSSYVSSSARHFLLLARTGEGDKRLVVGFMYFYRCRDAGLWEMWAVGVEEQWRRRGLANKLVRRALVAAIALGADRFVFRWADEGREHGRSMARAIDRFLAEHFPASEISHDGGFSWKRCSGTGLLSVSVVQQWTVKLGPDAPYPRVQLKRRHAERGDYHVVEVDITKLIALHDRDQMRISDAEFWPSDKRQGLQEFLDPHDSRPAEMPLVSVRDAPMPGWWAHLRKERWPAVAFTNGRHRTRLLAYFGATAMPVEVHDSSVHRLIELCGLAAHRA